MKNNSHAMKIIFDRMRTDSEFRTKMRDNLAKYDDPILAAADWEDPIGDVVGMASEQGRPVYVFLFKKQALTVGFGMTPSEVGSDDRNLERAIYAAPSASIGMAIEASQGAESITVIVRHPKELDGAPMETSRLVFA